MEDKIKNEVEDKDIIYKRYESQISREDKLINSRLTWLHAFQGFLITALTILVKENTLIKELLKEIIPFIIAMGLLSSLTTLGSLYLANKSLMNLHQQWSDKNLDMTPSPFGIQILNKGYYLNLIGPSSVIPLCTLFFWLYILLRLKKIVVILGL